MTEPRETIGELSAADPEFIRPRQTVAVDGSFGLLRLPPDTGRQPDWVTDSVPARYRITSRVFYQDPGAAEGQALTVAASVAFLVGHDQGWRYSVGVTVRTDSPTEAGHTGYSLAYGDVASAEEARWKAEEAATLFLQHPHLPPPPAPIPNLDLVAPVPTEQTRMDVIKRRLHLLRDIAENIEDEDFALDEEMRAALTHVAEDTEYLMNQADDFLAHGLFAKNELDEVRAALAAGEGFDGFHTHNELYEQRMLLLANLVQRWYAEGVPVVKSWRHHTGETCHGGGWFIVVMQLVTGQVSFHVPERDWELFHVPGQELAPVWDGHTPQEALRRLREAISMFPSNAKLVQRRCDNTDPHDPHPYSWSHVLWCASQRPDLERA